MVSTWMGDGLGLTGAVSLYPINPLDLFAISNPLDLSDAGSVVFPRVCKGKI